MSGLSSKNFWVDTAERAVKTLAQSLIATLTVGAATPVWELNWYEAVGIALTATLLSVLTSVASVGAAEPDTASLVNRQAPRETAGVNKPDPSYAAAAEVDGSVTPVREE